MGTTHRHPPRIPRPRRSPDLLATTQQPNPIGALSTTPVIPSQRGVLASFDRSSSQASESFSRIGGVRRRSCADPSRWPASFRLEGAGCAPGQRRSSPGRTYGVRDPWPCRRFRRFRSFVSRLHQQMVGRARHARVGTGHAADRRRGFQNGHLVTRAGEIATGRSARCAHTNHYVVRVAGQRLRAVCSIERKFISCRGGGIRHPAHHDRRNRRNSARI